MPGIAVQDLHGVDLDPRYEIRVLTEDTAPWVSAILSHGFAFHNPVWAPVYKGTAAKLCLQNFPEPDLVALYRYRVTEGISFGVFDTQYVFKRPESAATGGAVYWHELDPNDPALESEGGARLLEAMDFPLVSISLGHDQGKGSASSPAQSSEYWPMRTRFMQQVVACDPRPEGAREAKEPGVTLGRSGTYTRWDYAGLGLMGKLAEFVVLEAAARGFTSMQIPCGNDAVYRRYMKPHKDWKGRLLFEAPVRDIEVEGEDGKTTRPFEACTIYSVKFVWLDLVAK